MHFVIQYRNRPGTQDLRDEHHPRHIEFRKGLGTRVLVTGPFLAEDADRPVGSLMIVEAVDLASARETANADPLVVVGVFEIVSVSPFRLMAINPPAKP